MTTLTDQIDLQEFLFQFVGGGDEDKWQLIKNWINNGNEFSRMVGHEALYSYPDTMQHNGTLLANAAADTGVPRITLADAATQRVKWVWAIPWNWNVGAFRWASTNEAASSGLVRWQFAYKMIYLGEGNVDGAVTTIAIADRSSGGQFDNTYNTPSETAAIPLPKGALGDSAFMLCSLSRLGAADAHSGGVSVMNASLTLVS